jgi:hypothetical protein
MYMRRADQSPSSGADSGPQYAQTLNLASRYQFGTDDNAGSAPAITPNTLRPLMLKGCRSRWRHCQEWHLRK